MEVKVQVMSRKFIKPSTPTPNHLRTYKLSFFDQQQAPVHVPCVFFYPASIIDNLSNNTNITTRSQQLEKSLSETLSFFYPLSGRFGQDGLSIDCHDQGAEYLEAQVNCTLAEFLEQEPKNFDLLCDFVPMALFSPISTTIPIVAIQVNLFECGGLALATQASHIVCDGFTALTFFYEWAKTSRLGIDKVICPHFGLASLFPAREIPQVKPPPQSHHSQGKLVTKSFSFHGSTITNLRANLSTALVGIKKPPSRIEVVTTLIWKALINVSRAKHGKLRPSLMPVPVNLRGRTALAIPENTFGNFFFLPLTKAEAEESKVELDNLVRLLGDTVRNMLASLSETKSADDICSMIVNLRDNKPEEEDLDYCSFTSLCRFPIYDVDFGWGQPSWVSCVAGRSEQIVLIDTKCGTGVEVQARNMLASLSETKSADDICSMIVNLRDNKPEGEDLDYCSFTSLCRFPIYDVDFGWGQPSWVSCVAGRSEQIVLIDTKCGTGVEVQVNLSEIDMLQFEREIALTSSSMEHCFALQ